MDRMATRSTTIRRSTGGTTSRPPHTHPAATPSTPTPAASDQSAVDHLQPHDWLRLGPYGVGNLGCDGQEVAWSTSTQPISKQNSQNDVTKAAAKTPPQPRVVA